MLVSYIYTLQHNEKLIHVQALVSAPLSWAPEVVMREQSAPVAGPEASRSRIGIHWCPGTRQPECDGTVAGNEQPLPAQHIHPV